MDQAWASGPTSPSDHQVRRRHRSGRRAGAAGEWRDRRHHRQGRHARGAGDTQRAVRAAVPDGFQVRVLKPTADLHEERVAVSAMSKWSGGEKLTAAVVLYCIVARLRARNRSRAAAVRLEWCARARQPVGQVELRRVPGGPAPGGRARSGSSCSTRPACGTSKLSGPSPTSSGAEPPGCEHRPRAMSWQPSGPVRRTEPRSRPWAWSPAPGWSASTRQLVSWQNSTTSYGGTGDGVA